MKCSSSDTEKAQASFYAVAKERGYTVIGPYENTNKKIQMTCPVGHDVLLTPKLLKRGVGCGQCISYISRGEQTALDHLTTLGLTFEHNKNAFFPEKPQLRPDFVFPSIKAIIEIDGPDHFDAKRTRDCPYLHKNDAYKDQWCLDNGWHMVRIPYLNHRYKTEIPNAIDTALAGIQSNPTHLFSPIGTDYYTRPTPCPRP